MQLLGSGWTHGRGVYGVNHNMHNLNDLITQLLGALVRGQKIGL